MKDQLVALVEAVRLARLEIECYRDPTCSAPADWTVERLSELLESKAVSEAMQSLAPGERDSPSVIPADAPPIDLRVPYPWRSH
jgi:hypothetical protein